jgi:hypothetical protein
LLPYQRNEAEAVRNELIAQATGVLYHRHVGPGKLLIATS